MRNSDETLFRILEVFPDEDLVIASILNNSTSLPVRLSLSEVNTGLEYGRYLPVEYTEQMRTPLSSASAKSRFDRIKPALSEILTHGFRSLSERPVWPLIRQASDKYGIPSSTINRLLGRVVKAGGVLEAAAADYAKCGRKSSTPEKLRPTSQPGSYALSAKDLSNISKGVELFLRDEATWKDAYDQFLEKFYASRAIVHCGQKVIIPRDVGERPSFRQFCWHGKKLVKLKVRIRNQVGERMMAANHRGKPNGQTEYAIYPGQVTELDWTLSDIVAVSRGTRLSIGRLVIYVLIDVYSGIIQSLYFPKILPGELFISALARARDSICPGKLRLMGPQVNHGWTIPCNGRLIQKSFIDLSRPTDEDIIDGSIYHILSPFISNARSSLLRKKLFESGRVRRAPVGPYQALRYCPLCAEQDRLDKIPAHWRVIQNHPAVTCCHLHGALLRVTGATFSKTFMPSPGRWITPDIVVEPASAVEIRIARSIDWINSQRSRTPIPMRGLIKTLQVVALFRGGRKSSSSSLLTSLESRYGDAITRLDPAFPRFHPERLWQHIPLARCLLLADFLELSLADLVPESQYAEGVAVDDVKERWADRIVQDFLRVRPSSTRMQVFRECGSAYLFLRKRRKRRFDSLMPSRHAVGNRVDWAARDERLSQAISHQAANHGHMSREVLLQTVGLDSRELSRNRERLPLTCEAVRKSRAGSIRQSKPSRKFASVEEATEWARSRLQASQSARPEITANQFRALEPAAYRILLKYSSELIPKREALDWTIRDRELAARLESMIGSSPPTQRIISSKLLAKVGEPEQLMRYAKGRLPLSEVVIKSAVATSKLIGTKKTLPERKGWTGRYVDWRARDSEFCLKIQKALPTMTVKDRVSATMILRAAGITHFAFILARGRLPNTSQLASSLVVPFNVVDDKRVRLQQLMQANPNHGRWALEQLDRHTVSWLRNNDKAYLDRVLPSRSVPVKPE